MLTWASLFRNPAVAKHRFVRITTLVTVASLSLYSIETFEVGKLSELWPL